MIKHTPTTCSTTVLSPVVKIVIIGSLLFRQKPLFLYSLENCSLDCKLYTSLQIRVAKASNCVCNKPAKYVSLIFFFLIVCRCLICCTLSQIGQCWGSLFYPWDFPFSLGLWCCNQWLKAPHRLEWGRQCLTSRETFENVIFTEESTIMMDFHEPSHAKQFV